MLAALILTFFLSRAFSYWNKVYNTTPAIQGRINDFGMLLTAGSQRRDGKGWDKVGKGTTTSQMTLSRRAPG